MINQHRQQRPSLDPVIKLQDGRGECRGQQPGDRQARPRQGRQQPL
jgi:hypothetical protein